MAIRCLLLTVTLAITHAATQCPMSCSCDMPTKAIMCTSGTLRSLPEDLWSDAKSLSVHGYVIDNLVNDTLQMPQLVNLDLSNNGLQILPEEVFSELVELQELTLANNELDSKQLHALLPIVSLKLLNLSSNNVTSLTWQEAFIHAHEFVIHAHNTSDINTTEVLNNTLNNNMTDIYEESITNNTIIYRNFTTTFKERNYLSNVTNLVSLDLSNNKLENVPNNFFENLPRLRFANLSKNSLQTIKSSWTEHLHDLHILDLSDNNIFEIDEAAFQFFVNLTELYLQNNKLGTIHPRWFRSLRMLTMLKISGNPMLDIFEDAFLNCENLQDLEISNMPNLVHIHYNAFRGLNKLRNLVISHNPSLYYIHAAMFHLLPSIKTIDLSSNTIQSVNSETFQNISTLEAINLSGNLWSCDCEAIWLLTSIKSDNSIPKLVAPEQIICHSPISLYGKQLLQLDTLDDQCTGVQITNVTAFVFVPVGGPAIIDCVAAGSPRPTVTWITPRHDVLIYHPAYIHMGQWPPEANEFHRTHYWHLDGSYYARHHLPPKPDRVHVLKNGSLYIDYVQRSDAGPYTCIAQNSNGNETIIIDFKLDYLILLRTMIWSIVFGFSLAGTFLFVSIIVAIIRLIAFKCSKEERQKRKTIKQILDSIDNYKTTQFGKLCAYKSAKIDQISAFKKTKVGKLKNYKNVTVTSLVAYMERVREYYMNQIHKIRENTTQQVDKVCENYNSQMEKFKDYRSHQIDRIRDNYQQQAMKIRDYSTQQVEKLREQYKLQQNHILKIIEILDIGNCMTTIEAECLRTESMIFQHDLGLPLDHQPVHVPRYCLSSDESEYETAGSNVDVSSEKKKPQRPARNKRNRPQKPKDPNSPEEKETEPRRPRRRRRNREKEAGTADPGTEGSEPQKRHRHRNGKRRRKVMPKVETGPEGSNADTVDLSMHDIPNIILSPSLFMGLNLPPGVELPPGIQLPPGMNLSSGHPHMSCKPQQQDKRPTTLETPAQQASVYMEAPFDHHEHDPTTTDYETPAQSRDQTPEATDSRLPVSSDSSLSCSTPTLTCQPSTGSVECVVQIDPLDSSIFDDNVVVLGPSYSSVLDQDESIV